MEAAIVIIKIIINSMFLIFKIYNGHKLNLHYNHKQDKELQSLLLMTNIYSYMVESIYKHHKFIINYGFSKSKLKHGIKQKVNITKYFKFVQKSVYVL